MKIATAILMLSVLGVAYPLSSRAESLLVGTEVEEGLSGKVHTPPKGSAERKAILGALRAEMKRLHQADFIFTVNYLKVQQGWAWIEGSPKSPDGTSNLESVSALMHKRGKRWEVAEIPCTEEGNPDCLADPGFFKKLKTKFPKTPLRIFPKS